MADNDVYLVNWITELNGVAMSNSVSMRASPDAAVGQEFNNILNLFANDLLIELMNAVSIEAQVTCITARRVTPPTSATFTRQAAIQGVGFGDSLPSTCYLKMRYYSDPFVPRTSYGLRISGIAELETVDGRVSAANLAAFDGFLGKMLSRPYTFGGAGYFWSTNQAYPPATPPNHEIARAQVVPCIYNLRSRQTRLCGS